jgi:hypothetical protein
MLPVIGLNTVGFIKSGLSKNGNCAGGARIMISGMTTLTLVHVALSLIGIFAGFFVVLGLLTAKPLDGWTALFLASTVATSVTGFFFPFRGITPADVFGVLSLIVLPIAMFARYGHKLAGGWRRTYVITAMIALYLNVFVLIAQLFDKAPALKVLAPTKSEPPFMVTQLVVLVLFVVLTIAAAKRFREKQPQVPA